MPSRTASSAWVVVLLALACHSQTGAGDDRRQVPDASGGQVLLTPEQVLASDACQSPAPGRAPLRRLSNAEYRNTLQDLLAPLPSLDAALGQATRDFVDEAESLGFRNNADFLRVSSLVAQGYLDAAESLAPLAAATPALVGCTTRDAACARQFVQSFGARAFRRPLEDDEVQRYAALFDQAVAKGYDFQTGIEWIVFTLLQSTQFLYRVELGATRDDQHVPSQYETASRLSYLIWQSMPDATLFDAAARGELATPQQIEAQARRMLADGKSARLLEYFDQWLDLDHLATFDRDASIYPDLPDGFPDLLRAETHAYIGQLLRQPGGSLGELLSGQYSFLNAELARHYGVSGPTGADFERVEMPGRSGVLTQGMLLSRDKPTRTSIVRRGLKVRLDMLCETVPAPPNNVQLNLEALGDGLTQRQRLEKHRTTAACAGCHNLMDPIGVVFEGFDAVGRARSRDEQGQPIDSTSQIAGTRDIDGDVSDAVGLGQRLAASQEVRDCYVLQAFRFFYGRQYTTADHCSMAKLQIAFRDADQSLSELIVALTQTDQFLYRPAPELE